MTVTDIFCRSDRFEDSVVTVGGWRIRVRVRRGTGVPLVLCNGIGASLEVLDPLVAALDPCTTVIRFDVPGTGGSPASPVPYGLPALACGLGRLLTKIGCGVVDVLGLSWGGALAQQFALQNPRRCRRLVLVATGTGALMVPGHPRVLAKMLTPRRFTDTGYAAAIAGDLYGGTARRGGADIARIFRIQNHSGSRIGYIHQLLAGATWSSLPVLPLIRQHTLIVAGTDDPIIPVLNARIMDALLPHATVQVHAGGHVDILTRAVELAPTVTSFLAER
ncbi:MULTISPECIES: alpha/beta fold hydrolase [Rhodococcus]|uniref:Alpha/beta fold hydrolase n=2 Tax=Rhodococcus TaxID=1827 RepID=A0AAE4V3J2_9NOCA|nr:MULTISPECIES: alpha/beta fold hydrolase [Rhodococcus]MDV7243535.1 alpha/beta fold hydrolase [Rhodococcus oxybenzonivorans]MDV7267958.1 alpha/beta fold hydrolase [Rhodococcus oxybenzonivorans]MDV7277511.1 alpha/beta fold hydrolase [Rhodococcus oxybenzonivorans]MDV7335461.1 alpha/beta fold hydrolase [Rhodococcus oxybenzonivorans]MDV7347223.1 alpha/beta fold hydrolase [Rhodococcus oxybenzonivorans]